MSAPDVRELKCAGAPDQLDERPPTPPRNQGVSQPLPRGYQKTALGDAKPHVRKGHDKLAPARRRARRGQELGWAIDDS